MNSFLETLKQLGPARLGIMGAMLVGLLLFFVFVSFPYLMAYKHSITVVRGILPLRGTHSGPMLLCCWICHVGSMAFSFVHDASWN